MQGLGLRKNSRRTPEKLFGGSAEAKEPQKRHVQGSDGRNRYEGWLVGVREAGGGSASPESGSHALTRRRVRCSRRPEKRVGGFLAPVLREKLEISSRRSLRCGKKTSSEKFAGKFAGGECFLTTIRLTGKRFLTTIRPTGKRFLTTIRPTRKLWGLGKLTGMKHGHRKVSWN